MALTPAQIATLSADIPEDLIAAWALWLALKKAFDTLPPVATRKYVDYATALGVPSNTPLFEALALADTIKGQTA